MEGKENVFADMSYLPHRPSDSNDDTELSSSELTDNTFEVSMIINSNIYSKAFDLI